MCVSKINVKNNTKRYRPGTKMFHSCACGHCPECVSKMQDEWFVRTWSEIKRYQKQGGKVIFFTLTYDDDNLPVFTDVDEETGEVFHLPCFNKEHKNVFLKGIRDWFENRGLHFLSPFRKPKEGVKYTSLPMKFIWPCEYGETPGRSHRSHYHPMIFFPKECLDLDEFYNPHDKEHKKFLEYKLKNLIQEYWPHGYVGWSDPKKFSIFVDSEFAPIYATKYMCKDTSFYESNPDVMRYLYDEKGHKKYLHWQKFKDFRPQHWQSQDYGSELAELCQDDNIFMRGFTELSPGFEMVMSHKRAIKSKKTSFRVPMYIIRKLLYYTDEHGSLQLNERGLRVFGSRQVFEEKLYKLNSDYRKFFDESYISSQLLCPEDYQKLGITDCQPSSVIQAFKLYLGSRTLNELSLYALYLQDRGCLDSDLIHLTKCLKFQSMSIPQLTEACYDLYRYSLSNFKDTVPFVEEGFFADLPRSKYYTFNQMKRFQGFDYLLSMFQLIRCIASDRAYKVYLKKRHERKMKKYCVA